ncbi:MAG: iron-containing alcohol dehydrogenase [Candidatus Methanosuratincola sp.]|nr:iron-containing alcohol dehydrogenase [Candidatus Methanosuratincola sp.]
MSNGFDLLNRAFTFYCPTRIVFGIGSLSRLPDELKKFNFKKALLVSGPRVSKTKEYALVKECVSCACAELSEFTMVEAEPDMSILNSLAGFVRKSQPEIVVGIGGGSSMDFSKLASALSVNEKDPASYFGGEKITKKGPPIITIPTLAGTGSEVTPISVVVDNGVKRALFNHALYPALAVVDPRLSCSASPDATASAGIDALCHALESMMSVDSNPISDSLSSKALGLACAYLERAYCNGGDLEARAGLSAASLLAGIAFQATGLCLPHGIAYTYATKCSLPHGSSVSLAAPYVAIFNAPAIPGKTRLIASAMGIDTCGASPIEAGFEIASRMFEIMDTLGLPQTLEDLGINESELESMVDDLLANHYRFVEKNPRKPSRDELLDLYMDMHEGL